MMPQTLAVESTLLRTVHAQDVVHWTKFPDTAAQTLERLAMPWAEVVEMIRRPDEWPSKHAMPLLKLATFGDLRTAKGALRHDANVIEITGIEADYDGEQVAPDAALERLDAAVRMRGKPGAGRDVIFVDHTQGAEAHVRRIIVVGETERVAGIEPSVEGMAAIGGFANGDFHNGRRIPRFR